MLLRLAFYHASIQKQQTMRFSNGVVTHARCWFSRDTTHAQKYLHQPPSRAHNDQTGGIHEIDTICTVHVRQSNHHTYVYNNLKSDCTIWERFTKIVRTTSPLEASFLLVTKEQQSYTPAYCFSFTNGDWCVINLRKRFSHA